MLKELTSRMRQHNQRLERAILRSIDFYTLAGIATGIVFVYTALSADCATGGDCAFANGDFANWLFPKIKAMEEFFYKHLAGRFPFVG